MLLDIYSLEGRLKEGLVLMPVPGTYKTWRKIEAPKWTATASLRPLDDPAILGALKDRRIAKAKPSKEDRIRLKASFAEKDKAKAIGAKWDADERVWWIPVGEQAVAKKACDLGFL